MHALQSAFRNAWVADHPSYATTTVEEPVGDPDRFIAKVKADALREAVEEFRAMSVPESSRSRPAATVLIGPMLSNRGTTRGRSCTGYSTALTRSRGKHYRHV